MFGRKGTQWGSVRQAGRDLEMLSLSLDDIDRYVVAACRARGYPEDYLPTAARRVRFLEARGLPGFSAFTREMLGAESETLQQRASITRPDGSTGGQCPMIDAVRLGEQLDDILATLTPEQVATPPMPSNPLLMVPKLAEYAGPEGIIMMATFYIRREPAARIFIDGHRAAAHGPQEALLFADNFGISRFPEETHGVPPLRGAHIDSIEFPVRELGNLMRRIEDLE
jgi:hypothetical protein